MKTYRQLNPLPASSLPQILSGAVIIFCAAALWVA